MSQPLHTRAALLLLAFSIPATAMAKCPIARFIVGGETALALDQPIELTIRLMTPKGNVTKSATISQQPSFIIDVPFDTLSSYSPLIGHRCNNLPKTMVITAQQNGKVLGESRLKFKNIATASGMIEYTLRGKFIIDASGIRLKD